MTSTVLWTIAGFMFALALAPSVYFYDQYRDIKGQLHARGKAPSETAKELEGLVSRHMSLPKESPSIARVSDRGALAAQEFFKKAENGDKVLIYKNAKLAVLYRPSTDKIINVGPILLGAEESTAKPALAEFDIVVYNGSSTRGYAKEIGDQVQSAHPNLTTIKLADARGIYPKSVVVVLNTEAKAVAEMIAKELGGAVGALPGGEASPAADLLIIAGK